MGRRPPGASWEGTWAPTNPPVSVATHIASQEPDTEAGSQDKPALDLRVAVSPKTLVYDVLSSAPQFTQVPLTWWCNRRSGPAAAASSGPGGLLIYCALMEQRFAALSGYTIEEVRAWASGGHGRTLSGALGEESPRRGASPDGVHALSLEGSAARQLEGAF